MPISLMIRNGLHALKRKLVTRLLISSLANLLVMAIFTLPLAPDDRRLSPVHGGTEVGETNEALADFMQRVALAHVAGLRAPPAAAARAATIVATSEPAPAAVVPLPTPRPAAVPRNDRASPNKLHGAASAPKVLPSAQPLHAITESAVVSAPVKVEQPQYGMRLVATLEHILSASEWAIR